MVIPRRFSGLVSAKGVQLAKFLLVTAINVGISQVVLYIANTRIGLSGGWASVVAAVIGMVPAYLLYRYWVWEQTGPNSLRSELFPFFAIAVLGLVVSALLAEIADRTFGAGLAVNAGNLIGYFMVWVVKFLLLERLFSPPVIVEESFVIDEPANVS